MTPWILKFDTFAVNFLIKKCFSLSFAVGSFISPLFVPLGSFRPPSGKIQFTPLLEKILPTPMLGGTCKLPGVLLLIGEGKTRPEAGLLATANAWASWLEVMIPGDLELWGKNGEGRLGRRSPLDVVWLDKKNETAATITWIIFYYERTKVWGWLFLKQHGRERNEECEQWSGTKLHLHGVTSNAIFLFFLSVFIRFKKQR